MNTPFIALCLLSVAPTWAQFTSGANQFRTIEDMRRFDDAQRRMEELERQNRLVQAGIDEREGLARRKARQEQREGSNAPGRYIQQPEDQDRRHERWLQHEQLELERRRVAALEAEAQAKIASQHQVELRLREIKTEYDAKLEAALVKMRYQERQRLTAQYNLAYDASEARANREFSFSADPKHPGFRMMAAIDRDLDDKNDPLFRDPNKPYIIAKMASERLQKLDAARITGNITRARAKGVLPVAFASLPLHERQSLVAARQEFLLKPKPATPPASVSR